MPPAFPFPLPIPLISTQPADSNLTAQGGLVNSAPSFDQGQIASLLTRYYEPLVITPVPAEKRVIIEGRAAGFVPKTERGRRLWALRLAIIASGQMMLTPEQVEAEVLERRGEAHN